MPTTNSVNSSNSHIQTVSVDYATYTTITGVIPFDDTIPQSGEGTEIFSLAFTPKFANSILEISLSLPAQNGPSAGLYTIALFQDAGADAIAANQWAGSWAGANACAFNDFYLKHIMIAGTTAATTFKVYLGSNNAANKWYTNGYSTARTYGGIMHATLIINEYVP